MDGGSAGLSIGGSEAVDIGGGPFCVFAFLEDVEEGDSLIGGK